MSTLIIRKKSLKTWLHTDSVLGDFIISKFYFNADNGNFQVVEQGQSKRVIYDVTDITLYDDTDGGSAETFANITALSLRLEELNYPAFQYDGQIVSIANLIDAGTNVTITGDGTEASPYIINSSGGGGGSQTLNETLVLGNETDGEDILLSDDDKILLDNGANLKKGTTDAGLGGAKGIALRCAVDYELKWEAGRLYVMGGDGFTIREVSHNFTTTPTVNDDTTKGFVIDSRWILDNGDLYICTDATTGDAVWELQSVGAVTSVNSDAGAVIVDLQSATDEGNETTNDVIFRLDADKFIKVDSTNQVIQIFDLTIDAVNPIAYWNGTQISFADASNNVLDMSPTYFASNFADGSLWQFSGAILNIGDGSGSMDLTPNALQFNAGANATTYTKDNITVDGVDYTLPTGATSQIATLLDIPAPITIDATPTDGSSNAVSSNGVFDALALKQDNIWNYKNSAITFVDDFITGGVSNLQYSGNLIYVFSGSGANALNSNSYPNRTNQEGVVGLNTGTTATGASAIRSDVNAPPLFIGNGAISYEVYINVETLSDATNRFYNIFGFIGNAVPNNTTNAIYFLYDEGGVVVGNSANANWKCVTINSATRTFTTTSVAVTASAWVKLRIEINANATSVGFFINDILVATNTTNIPTTSTPITIFNGNIKTIGTTSRITYIDYIAYRKIFTTTR